MTLSLVLFIYRAGQMIEVRELVMDDQRRIHVTDPPHTLRSGEVTVLDITGPLYFAAARTLRERLPDRGTAENAAVVLRLRGGSQVGATFIDEISEYAAELGSHGGRLYLCGMSPATAARITRAGRLAVDNNVRLVPGEKILGDSLHKAVRQAREWVSRDRDG